MTNEQLRMQFIGGIITESEYKAKIEENKSPKSKKSLNENIVSIGAINNPFPKHKKSDYELAFEHFTKGGLNEEEGNPFKMGSNINTIEELEQALKSMFPNSQVTLNYDEEGDGVYIDGIYVSEGAYQKWDTYNEDTDEEKSFTNDEDLMSFLKGGLNENESLEGLDEDKKTLPSSAHHIAKQVIKSGEFIIIDKPTSLNLKVDAELLGTYNGMFYHITKVKGKGKDRIYTIADDSFGDEEEKTTSDLRKYFLLDKR